MAIQNPHRVDLGSALARYMGDQMTAKQLDQAMNWTGGKASRVIDGKRTLSEKDVASLVDVLQLSSEDSDELRRLAMLARKRKANPLVADYAASYVAFEQDAVSIDAFSDELVPGIAQSGVYATAVLSCADANAVAERVAARLDRQKILAAENPPRVRILLGEAALYRMIGGPVGLRQQLEHLVSLLDMERIELGIVQFNDGAHQCQGSRFNLVRRANGDVRIYIESALTSMYLHETEDVEAHQRIFDRLWALAAQGGASATILRKRIQKLA